MRRGDVGRALARSDVRDDRSAIAELLALLALAAVVGAIALFLSGCSGVGADEGAVDGAPPADSGGPDSGPVACTGKNFGPDGRGGTCECAVGFAHDSSAASGGCHVDPAARWTVYVSRGGIAPRDPSGAYWDTSAGAPDPRVCVTPVVDSPERCVIERTDSYAPTWGAGPGIGDLGETTGAALTGEGLKFRYIDVDAVVDDTICEGVIRADEGDLRVRVIRISCKDPASWFEIGLGPR